LIEINVTISELFTSLISEEILTNAALKTLERQLSPENISLSLVIEDNKKLQELNSQYLGIDSPTDVLSFPAGDVDPETGQTYLGDVIISYPRAKEQAEKAVHDIKDELQLLVIHGVLHLLDFDHDTVDAKTKMWQAQADLIDYLNLHLNRLPED
jgi:probable rRNA maturation factor